MVHACAVRVKDDYKLAATIGPVLSMQPYVSMSARPQVCMLQLRQAGCTESHACLQFSELVRRAGCATLGIPPLSCWM